ncbi:Gfo/Idh/MocA family oxidoreductase [Ruficoccus sp. ZRK36]|uniref:Gfo/Idh/MocA family protein n=1 Tax=Ruficoccus sp. ZRK36 TaxID=2866311 RepID=UPI001C734376|nr:Gfo/Idh/MocA family oxidoreductase [Ruficoccus sp. ZRK36]QYY34527.1 Gfo/Idh/MocA family oxidoreductase [Ruficoccus sp. ZRK36]
MSEKIKVGIWGLGRAGLITHVSELQQYPQQFEIRAGMDIDPERNRIFSEKTGAPAYDSEEAFLQAADVDLISIATRSQDHVSHCERALSTGKFVFLEKPIALTRADGARLLELDKQYPGKLFLRHNRRFEAPFNNIKGIIASGKLGQVAEIKLCRHSYFRRSDWQTLLSCGGGQLNNWGPHIIDHALQFLDYKVQDMWSDLKCIAAIGDAEDHVKIVFKGESGLVVDLEISGGAALPQNDYTVFGTRGALTCRGHEIHLKYIDPDQVFKQNTAIDGNPPLEGGFTSGYADLETVNWVEEKITACPAAPDDLHRIWYALYAAIREGVQYPITVEQGVAVVNVIDAVRAANPAFAQH